MYSIEIMEIMATGAITPKPCDRRRSGRAVAPADTLPVVAANLSRCVTTSIAKY